MSFMVESLRGDGDGGGGVGCEDGDEGGKREESQRLRRGTCEDECVSSDFDRV